MSTLYDPANPTAEAIRRQAAARRIEQYAAKFRADTIGQGDYRKPTDENLAAVLQGPGIIRKARPAEFPAIRAAVLAWSPEVNGPAYYWRCELDPECGLLIEGRSIVTCAKCWAGACASDEPAS